MSEKTLNNVIRNLRMAKTYLETAELMADQMLQNHAVATEIHLLKLDVVAYGTELDTEYRQSHFTKGRRGR